MKIREKIKQYAARQRAIRELEALDDRTLHDMGVSRGHIRGAVEGR